MQRIAFMMLCIIPMIAYADNFSFLNYSAISYFQGQDKTFMMSNAIKALNQYPDGKKASWNNQSTGSFGYAIPSKTTTANGLTCRNLTIFNSAKHVTGEATYRLCKVSALWKFVPKGS